MLENKPQTQFTFNAIVKHKPVFYEEDLITHIITVLERFTNPTTPIQRKP